jgi:hypothetical protein
MRTKTKLSLAGLFAAVAMAAVPAGASATTGTFTSGGPSPIPDNSLSLTPVTVSGLPGLITDVNVTVNDLSHTSDGSDIDLLLRNPNGGSVILLSDAGGADQALTPSDFTFDDAAAGTAPNSGALSGGMFKPTNIDGGDSPDTFTGAPAGPYGATLAALNGSNANAVWELYARDDTADLGAGGFVNYSVTVTTQAQSDPPAGPKPKKAKKKKKCKPKKGKGTVGKKPKKCKKKKGKPHQ